MLATAKSGVGYYVSNVLEQLAELDKENEYFLYSNRPFTNAFLQPKFVSRIYGCKYNNWWLQYHLPGLLKKDRIDLFWGGGFTLPIMPGPKKVVTIHDYVFRRFPKTLIASQVLHFRAMLPLYLYSADRVIVDSYNTAKDLQIFNPYSAEKASVIHLAAHQRFFERLSKQQVSAVLRKYDLQPGYALFVGTVEPRKGVDTVLKAANIYNQRFQKPLQIVIVGQIGWKAESIMSLVRELPIKESIHFLEYMPEEDLPAIYQGAAVFLYPSLYEGFGMPVLEAMASGVPVITSTSSSLPEIAADAALYALPGNEHETADRLMEIMENGELGPELVERGYRQAGRFSWQETALKTLAVFNAVYNN